MTTWPSSLTSTLTTRTPECECALYCFFSFVCTSSHRAHSRGSSQDSCVCHPCHPHVFMKWATLFDLALPFYLTHLCRTPSTSSRTWSSWTTCCALRTKRVWTCLTIPTSAQVMRPTPTTSRRLLSSPTQSSWTRRPFFSDIGFPADAEYDDAALEGMLREAHRVHSHHSQREDLSVSLSWSSVSDRTGRPVGDRAGRPAEQSNQEAQIRTLLDKQKEQILAECQARLTDTNFKPLATEEVY